MATSILASNSLLQRQRDRLQSERVASNEDEEASFINSNNSIHEEDENEDDIEEQQQNTDTAEERSSRRGRLTLSELEEEREMARRRSSACVLFALFVLFRLWIEALNTGDIALLLVCLVGTSWTVRWIRYSRDQEAELDRRIAHHLADNDGTSMARDDLRMLSFQAQLALAIMESQRQMMTGGRPDHEAAAAGVGDTAKEKWETFAYKEMRDKPESTKSAYGALKQEEGEEEPHCSICLGEYEEGEELCRLPCSHIYHAECINSWCSNHTRCPLCNVDLEGEEPLTEEVV